MERNKAKKKSKQRQFNNSEPLNEREKNLLSLIFTFITRRQYKKFYSLFYNVKDKAAIIACLPRISMDLYHELCIDNLTEETFLTDQPHYECIEYLLNIIADYAPIKDFTIEVMQLIYVPPEADKNLENMRFSVASYNPNCVFETVITFLGPLLLRMPDNNEDDTFRLFYSCLNRIIMRRDMLCLVPEFMVLEHNHQDISYFAGFYIKIEGFYTTILNDVLSKPRPKTEIFRSYLTSKRNMVCCFLIKFLGGPFAYFKFNHIYPYATPITQSIAKCMGDPLFLLAFVEEKLNSETRYYTDIMDSSKNSNIFLMKFTLPLDALAIYYYYVIAKKIEESKIPRIYNPLYVCEKGLYLVHFLLSRLPEPGILDKALALAGMLLTNLGHIQIPTSDLDLHIHKRFINDLCNQVINPTYSSVTPTVTVLKQYILRLGDEDKYLILKQFMDTVKNSSSHGFLIRVYKELIDEALKETTKPMPTVLRDQHFQFVIMEYICKLPEGVKTDPVVNYYRIKPALVALILFAEKDEYNRTGFWNLTNDIHSKFISPLRKALQYFEALYKAGSIKKPCMNSGKKSVTLKDILLIIAKLRQLLDVACDCLANSPKDD